MRRFWLSIGLFTCLGLMIGCGSSPFSSTATAQSPGGGVVKGAEAYSPDGTRYAQEMIWGQGHVGIFRRSDGQLLVEFAGWLTPNDLKGLAWSPDSKYLAVMYHAGDDPYSPLHYYGSSYIKIFDSKTGSKVTDVDCSAAEDFIHYLAFGEDDKTLIVSTDGHHNWALATGL